MKIWCWPQWEVQRLKLIGSILMSTRTLRPKLWKKGKTLMHATNSISWQVMGLPPIATFPTRVQVNAKLDIGNQRSCHPPRSLLLSITRPDPLCSGQSLGKRISFCLKPKNWWISIEKLNRTWEGWRNFPSISLAVRHTQKVWEIDICANGVFKNSMQMRCPDA